MHIVAGDSWGAGEWKDLELVGPGLAECLGKDHDCVVNLSIPAGTNYFTTIVLEKFLKSLVSTKCIESIFVFQTEWIRDYTGTHSVEHKKNQPDLGYTDLKNYTISDFYFSLSRLSQNFKVPIMLIGGCSDVLFLDNFNQEYPGCQIACQSFTNLCVNNDHYTTTPTFELATAPENKITSRHSIIKKAKQYSNNNDVNDFLNDQDRAVDRVNIFSEYKQWFYPDGYHANRFAFEKLYKFLKKG